MKTRLFENTGGNKFRLLKESVNVNESLVASGLKKVFMNAGSSISYNHIESVGMGYIKDINTAKQVALQEARILAKEYGYKEDEDKAKFVKENDFSKLDAQNPSHALAKRSSDEPTPDETDMGNPEEKREVQIGREILKHIDDAHKENKSSETQTMYIHLDEIARLAEELIKMHGQQ
jgi:hypothetical protein